MRKASRGVCLTGQHSPPAGMDSKKVCAAFTHSGPSLVYHHISYPEFTVCAVAEKGRYETTARRERGRTARMEESTNPLYTPTRRHLLLYARCDPQQAEAGSPLCSGEHRLYNMNVFVSPGRASRTLRSPYTSRVYFHITLLSQQFFYLPFSLSSRVPLGPVRWYRDNSLRRVQVTRKRTHRSQGPTRQMYIYKITSKNGFGAAKPS